MRSLSSIVKASEKERDVKPYDFFADFRIAQAKAEEEAEQAEQESEPEVSEEELAEEERRQQLDLEVQQILNDARQQAEIIRQEAYEEGIAQGREDGYLAAHEEHKAEFERELSEMQKNIADIIQSVTIEKEKVLEQYADDLKKISLAVAEKIIHTSIQSSGEVVKRMILAATDKITKKQWAKIYITKYNTGVSMEIDAEFMEALAHLSDNIKIVTMDNGEEGSCIIELPDEIIDASVGTQMENIKDILNNARV